MKYTTSFKKAVLRKVLRWKKDGLKDKRKGTDKSIPKKLSPEEELAIYNLCCSDEYKELTPDEVIRKAREKNPLRWLSDKLHQYKISEFETLNPERNLYNYIILCDNYLDTEGDDGIIPGKLMAKN